MEGDVDTEKVNRCRQAEYNQVASGLPVDHTEPGEKN